MERPCVSRTRLISSDIHEEWVARYAKAPYRQALPSKLFYCAPNLVGLRLAKEMAIIVDRTHRLASARLMLSIEKTNARALTPDWE
jgi:hypothetical protein